MKNKITLVGLVVLILTITSISGCISSDTPMTYEDIIIDNPEVQSNGEGYPGEWMVTFTFRSTVEGDPESVTFNITLLDSNGKTLGSKIETVKRPFSSTGGDTAPIIIVKDVYGDVQDVNVNVTKVTNQKE